MKDTWASGPLFYVAALPIVHPLPLLLFFLNLLPFNKLYDIFSTYSLTTDAPSASSCSVSQDTPARGFPGALQWAERRLGSEVGAFPSLCVSPSLGPQQRPQPLHQLSLASQ